MSTKLQRKKKKFKLTALNYLFSICILLLFVSGNKNQIKGDRANACLLTGFAKYLICDLKFKFFNSFPRTRLDI